MIAMMITRTLTPRLLETLACSPATGLLGPRQAGKTTLALEGARVSGLPFIYLDLESEQDRAKLEQAGLYLGDHLDKLLILDEVHRAPGLFPMLRGLIDRNRRAGLLDTDRLRHFRPGKPADAVDLPSDGNFRSGGVGGDADLLPAGEPCRIDLVRPVDQVAGDATGNRHFLQAPGVGTVRVADDDDQVALFGQRLDGVLAVLRRVADVVLLRTLNIGELLLEGSDDDRGIVDGQRGLGDEGELVRDADPRTPDAFRGLDQVNVRRAIS